ncbi:MAG: thioredoxin-disulfide reductase [Chloroflexi bacterium RBG_13_51_52]|nr:MAG: thioredoxin-disulfide reductase [Chloroflexi bacterium RBG_13_51_52]
MAESIKKYDVVIIGGGPAGLSAGIYTARARFSTLLIEKGGVGGQIINSEMVENYPGFPQGIGGIDLTQAMHQQATKFGMETLYDEVTGIKASGKQKTVKTSQGQFTAKAVIIAGGADRLKLGVPGEKEFTGKGVSYCATCDGAFFRDKAVAVVGGGNAAVTEALELTKFASKITLIHRRNELRATQIMQERIKADAKIKISWDTVVLEILGDKAVEKIRLQNVKTRKESTLPVSGVFVAVGSQPATGYLKEVLKLDNVGAIIANDRLETSVPGIFAAGDIRSGSIRQVISAAGDGAIAAVNAGKYVSG